jgi:type IV secretion system protein VirB11
MLAELDFALAPIAGFLSDPATEDLAINEPGVAWQFSKGGWTRHDAPGLTYRRLHGISALAASQTRQTISVREPVLSADIESSGRVYRLQSVMPPAVPAGTMALTFRRPDDAIGKVGDIRSRYDIARWNRWKDRGAARQQQRGILLGLFDAGAIEEFLHGIVRTKLTVIFSGSTGAGKTYLSKMLGALIPEGERIIAIENARELVIRQPNHVRHIYSSSGGVTETELLACSLRERPDRIMVGELREGKSADTFLNEVMAGHPGSMTTIHGRNAAGACRRLFNLIKSANPGAEDQTLIAMLGNAIDVIIPVSNDAGVRSIGEVWFADDAARRGETVASLLRQD